MRYTTRIIVPPRVRRSGAPGSPGAGPRPQAVGVRRSLGFGDRLGLAGPGHVTAAAAHPEFVPFFAQQSPRELAATGRTTQETLAAATRAVGNARYRQLWGADADLLRTPQDVDDAANAGFTYFTLDLSEHVPSGVDDLSPDELAAAVDAMVARGELPEDWSAPYLDHEVEVPGNERLTLTIGPLRHAAARFGRAVQHGARMYEAVSRANRGRPYEIEISLDGIAGAISTAEHLFIGLELEARGVRLTSLAPRLDDREPAGFEAALREHVAVASFCGPYKLSFRAGTHASSLLPIIGRCCGDRLHYKATAESFLEALRLAWRLEPERLRAVLKRDDLMAGDDFEAAFIDDEAGAGRLDAAASERFLSGQDGQGSSLQALLTEILERHADIYAELLVSRFERLVGSLNAG